MSTPQKETSLSTLRRLLGEAFSLHRKGGTGARLGRAYGVADGYMLALMDLEVASQKELGSVVVAARARQIEVSASGSSAGDVEPARAEPGGSNVNEPTREGSRAARVRDSELSRGSYFNREEKIGRTAGSRA